MVNQTTRQVKKLTANGHFIRQWQFGNDTPTGIEVSKQNTVYVLYRTDSGHVVRVLNSAGEMIHQWGESDGVSSPDYDISDTTIGVDNNENVYLVNRKGDTLQKFTSQGELIEKWRLDRLPNEDAGHLNLAINRDNEIYMVYQDYNRVAKYALDKPELRLIQEWKGFNSPRHLAFDRNGQAYVTDKENHRILKLLSEGGWEQWVSLEAQDEKIEKAFHSSPWAISEELNSDLVFLLMQNGILSFDILKEIKEFKKLFELFSMLLTVSSANNPFVFPRAIAIGGPGNTENVYVTVSSIYDSVQKYTLEGQFLTEWSNRNTGKDSFYAPFDIARDSQGYLYITDIFKHRVFKFASNGQFVKAWGQPGTAQGEFIMPTGIAVDNTDAIYVVDTGNLRVQKFDSEGRFLNQWQGIDNPDELPSDTRERIKLIAEKSTLFLPIDIAIDSQYHLYVTDLFGNNVKKFRSVTFI